MTERERCATNGWTVGTRLVGDEGYGPTVIEITAIGETHVLAKVLSHNYELVQDIRESLWTLGYRDWRQVW